MAGFGVATEGSHVIASLVPNPVGKDEELETVRLRNKGSADVPLAGWTLRDRSGFTWTLTGTLAAGASTTIQRNRMAMSLNNGGDEITLVDVGGGERDRFEYSSSSEGMAIQTGH